MFYEVLLRKSLLRCDKCNIDIVEIVCLLMYFNVDIDVVG